MVLASGIWLVEDSYLKSCEERESKGNCNFRMWRGREGGGGYGEKWDNWVEKGRIKDYTLKGFLAPKMYMAIHLLL